MNIKKKINSINVKTLIYLVAFSVTILFSFWLFETLFINIFYEKYQIKTMDKIGKQIYNANSKELDAVLEDILYNNSVCIEYIKYNGEVIGYNTKSFGCLLGRNNRDVDNYKINIIKSNDDLKAVKLVNADYESEGLLYGVKQSDGYVFVFTMLEDINSTSIILKNQIIYIMFLVIVFSLVIAFFLSKRITKPIENITSNSKKLADGDYSVVFLKNGVTEIDELVDTLNYLEIEMSKTEEYRRDLMANVGHDLKTPLTMIKAYAEMVRDISYKDKKKREEHLETIIAETDRLNILVNDILTLSRLQASADVFNYEEFDLDKEIREILKRYEIIKETENYIINYEGVKGSLVYADKNKINQVIYNLINNAINYTGEDKVVKIRVKDQDDTYLVEIEDTGKGILEEDINYIWDKYYKKEKNHKRNVVGTGLGLSIVKNILSGHNFKYGVKSEKNKGTIFYFEINKSFTSSSHRVHKRGV